MQNKITPMDRPGRLNEEFRTRSKRFAGGVIRLYAELPAERADIQVCGQQLLEAATSMAAQVRIASRARTDEDFIDELSTALQSADSTQLLLELLREDCFLAPELTSALEQESSELIAIMTSIVRRMSQRSNDAMK